MSRPISFFFIFFIFFTILLHTHFSNQLQEPQAQAFFTILNLLNLKNLEENTDFCTSESTPFLTVVCYEDNITQIHTNGLNGSPPLPGNFSIEALFEAFSTFSGLKVLSLVSLGLWGPLPSSVGKLTSLEILNLSSNYLNGTIPDEISGLKSLQSIVLDHNKFSGKVPVWIGSFSGLNVLSLRNNSFNGSLPSSISSLQNLRILQISMNHFSGEFPDLKNLTNLQVLDTESNFFGPNFPVLHNKIVSLVLRNNRFRYGMLYDISLYYQLEELDVSLNGFVGPFPPILLSLPSIRYLDISVNKFTGMFLKNMPCGSELEFVNLSSNFLTGDLPNCLLQSYKKRVFYQGNCFSGRVRDQNPNSYCENEALAVKIDEKKRRSGSKAVVAMSVVGGVSLVGLVVLVSGLVLFKKSVKKPQTRLILEKATTTYPSKLFFDAREICHVVKLGPLGLPTYRNFLLEEIKEATSNFDKSNLIGEGSHGPIYKGKIGNERVVTVRSLKMKRRRSVQAYTHDIELFSKLRHTELVSALGHSFECHQDDSTVTKIYLVFEFLPNGTLRDFISGSIGQKLMWTQRIMATVGVAKGIQFLQTGIMPGLYSNNIKITDVLLDHTLNVKLSSYNLPLFSYNTDNLVDAHIPSSGSKTSSQAMVTQDEKTDVYNFGVILLEVITGRAIVSENDVCVVKDLMQVSVKADNESRKNIVDPTVRKECSNDALKKLMELSVRCLSNEPNERPSIEDVLWNLQFVGHIQDSWLGDVPSSKGSPIFCSQ